MNSTIDDIAAFDKYKNKLVQDMDSMPIGEVIDVVWASPHTFDGQSDKKAVVIVGTIHSKVSAAWKAIKSKDKSDGQMRRAAAKHWELTSDSLKSALEKCKLKGTLTKVASLEALPVVTKPAVVTTEKSVKPQPTPQPEITPKTAKTPQPVVEKWVAEWEKSQRDTVGLLEKLSSYPKRAEVIKWANENYPWEFQSAKKETYKKKLTYLEGAVLKKTKEGLLPTNVNPKALDGIDDLATVVQALMSPDWLQMQSQEIDVGAKKSQAAAENTKQRPTQKEWATFLLGSKTEHYEPTPEKITIGSEICSTHFTILPASMNDARTKIVGMAANAVVPAVFINGVAVSARAHATISTADNTKNMHLYLGAAYEKADWCPQQQSVAAQQVLVQVQARMVTWLVERIKAFQKQLT